MDVQLLGQLQQRAVALDRCDRHLRLEADVWFRRGLLLLMLSPDSRANLARRQTEAPPIVLCRFPKPALGQVPRNSADEGLPAVHCGPPTYSLSISPEVNADVQLVSCRELAATSKRLLHSAGSKSKAAGCRIK